MSIAALALVDTDRAVDELLRRTVAIARHELARAKAGETVHPMTLYWTSRALRELKHPPDPDDLEDEDELVDALDPMEF